MKADGPTWRLTLRAEGEGPPAIIRLRRCLKWLLRTWGLRCVSVDQVHAEVRTDVRTSKGKTA